MHTVFQSIHHPEDTPSSLVYARALVAPIGACTTPVMIGAAATALQGQPVWAYLVWGFPAALLVASVWTQFALSTTAAEVHLKPGQCAIRSVQEVLRDTPPEFHPLFNVRTTPSRIEIALGWDTQICARSDWPEYGRLRDAAQHAVDAHSEPADTTSG